MLAYRRHMATQANEKDEWKRGEEKGKGEVGERKMRGKWQIM